MPKRPPRRRVAVKVNGFLVAVRSTGPRGHYVGVAYAPGRQWSPDFVSGQIRGNFARRRAAEAATVWAVAQGRGVSHGQ